MRFTVIGAGAISGVFGGFLARARHDVTLVDMVAEHVEAIRRSGLRIEGCEEFTVHVPALTPQQLLAPLDVVLLAVKARHTLHALELARSMPGS